MTVLFLCCLLMLLLLLLVVVAVDVGCVCSVFFTAIDTQVHIAAILIDSSIYDQIQLLLI